MDENKDPKRQSWLSRTVNSVRTQYSVATAFILMVALAIFYIGGRIVLVHLVREAETQVRDAGVDISRLVRRNAEQVKGANAGLVEPVGRELAAGADPVRTAERLSLSLLAAYGADGRFGRGARQCGDAVAALEEADLAPYAERISDWIAKLGADGSDASPVGIMTVGGISHYVMMAPCRATGGYLMIGRPFVVSQFTEKLSGGIGGYAVRVAERRQDVAVALAPAERPSPPPSRERDEFGLAPMISEALNYYSGGFWDVGSGPFEVSFSVRDIAGRAIANMVVTFPETFSSVTRSAFGRLAFFVTTVGIFLILPIFWIQSRVVLNPISRMTDEIRDLAERHSDIDCPRLEWKGKDEFALLAASVNMMLETISARTVSLGQLKTRLEALVEGVPDALAVFDRRGVLVNLTKNPEGVPPVPGLSPGEPPDLRAFADGSSVAFDAALRKVFEDGGVMKISLCEAESSGPRPRSFELRLTRMDDMFALAIVRDVTFESQEHERRLAAERRLLDSSKRESLTLLAAGIAHDVNNLLAVVLNTVEASAEGDGATGGAKCVDAVRDAVKRGASMMRELMAFAGETKMSLSRAPASFVVEDAKLLVREVVGENITLSYDLAPDAPDVDVDPGQVWKVFFNIAKNASEAIGSRPGSISFSTRRFSITPETAATFISENPLETGTGTLFVISDDGPGLSEAVRSRIFDPYVSSKSLGRGLGLATVRTIVEAHGGGIRVFSELDKGTRFEVYLPESSLPPPSAVQKAESAVAAPSGVLVVDNDESILKTTSVLLKTLGAAVHVARDRRETLAVVRRFSDGIGTVLLDANLGGIDTVRLLEAIRIGAPGCRIVVSSGSREDDLRKMFAQHPYDGFLAKPYTLAELKAAILTK